MRSQTELRDRLVGAGFDVTQATLSRDLRALGAVKTAEGYTLPGAAGTSPTAASGAAPHGVAGWLLRATAAQNLVVLHTPIGGAQALGLALDRLELDEIVGTLAGDDTVLAVCPDNRTATRLAKRLTAWAGDR